MVFIVRTRHYRYDGCMNILTDFVVADDAIDAMTKYMENMKKVLYYNSEEDLFYSADQQEKYKMESLHGVSTLDDVMKAVHDYVIND